MMQSIGDLRHICQKPVESYDSYSLSLIYRRISIYITKIFLQTSITANQVTVMSLAMGLASSAVLASGHFAFGALAFLLSSVLDCVDGEIARYKNSSSVKGVYLDIITHYIIDPLMFTGLALGISRSAQDPEMIILLGVISAICVMLLRVFRDAKLVAPLQIKTVAMDNRAETKKPPTSDNSAGNTFYALMHSLKSLTPYVSDNVMAIVLILSIAGSMDPYLHMELIYSYLLAFYALTFPIVCAVVAIVTINEL